MLTHTQNQKKVQFEASHTDEPLEIGDFLIYQLGELHCEPGYVVDNHDQWCHEITYIISGEGQSILDGQATNFKANDIILSPSSGTHMIVSSRDSQLKYAYFGFGFKPTEDPTVRTLASFFNISSEVSYHDHFNIYPLMARCLDELYREDHCQITMMQSLITALLISTYRNSLPEQTVTRSVGSPLDTSTTGEVVYRVVRYVDTHIFNDLEVSVIAERLGYNPCYLSTIFKNKTGMTLQGYISQKKISKSIELMLTLNFSASKAAERLGYSNIQAFSRAFKRNMGMSPTEYIKHHLIESGSIENT